MDGEVLTERSKKIVKLGKSQFQMSRHITGHWSSKQSGTGTETEKINGAE